MGDSQNNGILWLALIFFVFVMILPSCSKKPDSVQAPSQENQTEQPVLQQNFLYQTNRDDSPKPKDLSFEESPDILEKINPRQVTGGLSD